MFTLLHVGALEVALFLVVCLVTATIALFTRSAFRWLPPVAVILVVSMICTPADPVSMVLLAVALLVTFFAGVAFAPTSFAGEKPESLEQCERNGASRR